MFGFLQNRIYKVYKNGKKRRVFWVRGLRIKFLGKKSTVLLHHPKVRFKKSSLVCGSNCLIEVGATKHRLNKLHILANADNSVCKIGSNLSCTDKCEILLQCESGLSVIIGDDCMFGTNVLLRSSDVHAIYDMESKNVVNYGKSIEIGDHCWLAKNVTILKGVKISPNIVIGTDSVVTKNCDVCNSIYGGFPAVLLKTNVNWDRKSPTVFDREK